MPDGELMKGEKSELYRLAREQDEAENGQK